MKLKELLFNLDISVDEISRNSGISKSTIYNLCNGKRKIVSCSDRVLKGISESLNINKEELFELEPEEYKPLYEKNLPRFLERDIWLLKHKRNSRLYDCYLDETNSSINICEVDAIITKDQADYLRRKFLGLENEAIEF